MTKTNCQKPGYSEKIGDSFSISCVIDEVSQVKAYYVLCDWSSVIQLSNETLQSKQLSEFDYDLFVCYVAAALMQQNEIEQSIQTLKKLNNLKKIKSELLNLFVSNCYESLGRIEFLMSNDLNGDVYFRKSATTLKASDTDMAVRFRYMSACLDFNKSKEFATTLSEEFKLNPKADYTQLEKRLSVLESKQKKLVSLIDRYSALSTEQYTNAVQRTESSELLINLIERGHKPMILIAGMRHCGSTALFNLVRLALNHLGYTVFSGYSEKIEIDKLKTLKEDCAVIKTHEIQDDIKDLADIIICPIRDIRDTIASAKRRSFPMLESMGVIEYSKHNRLLCQTWSALEDYCFRYENYMNEPEKEVGKLYSFLGIPESLSNNIITEVNDLPTDKYHETLLSATHITDQSRQLTYFDTLTSFEVKQITKYNWLWLKEYGYE